MKTYENESIREQGCLCALERDELKDLVEVSILADEYYELINTNHYWE